MSASLLAGGETTKKYQVPLDHMDYSYIEKCTNVKELEKIFKVLKSGEEGYYPDLLAACEKKLQSLAPKSRVLRKEEPVATPADLPKDEWSQIDSDLKDFLTDIQSKDQGLSSQSRPAAEVAGEDLPPVRTAPVKAQEQEKAAKKSEKSAKPRDYREWDKVDIDAELEKVDKETEAMKEKATKTAATSSKPAQKIDAKGLSAQEKEVLANREKDKGNEAFHAKDYEEAIIYYNRSLSLAPSAASFNNRAIAYIKLEMWDVAINDCDRVLKMEPDNVKAYLRRGVAYKGKDEDTLAKGDLQRVLALDPGNKRAQDLIQEINKASKAKAEQGRRMVIEDVSGSDADDEEDEVVVDKNKHVNAPKAKPASNQLNNARKSYRVQIEEASDSDDEEEEDGDELSGVKMNDSHVNFNDVKNISKPQENIVGKKDTQSENAKSENKTVIQKSESETSQDTQNEEKTAEAKTLNSEGTSQVDSNGISNQVAPPAVRPNVLEVAPLPDAVAFLKEAGNALFKTGQYAEAIEKYSKSIDKLKPLKEQHTWNLSTLYSNRAACKSKIGDCRGCVEDCSVALELVPNSFKPLLRRAQAYETMEKYKLAYVDYRHVLNLENSVETANQGSTRCTQMLQIMDGPRWRENLPSIPSPTNTQIPVFTTQAGIGGATKSTTQTTSTNSTSVTSSPSLDSISPTVASPAQNVLKEEKTTDAKFTELKNKGNDHVKKGEFLAAVDCYTGCVALMPDEAVSYTNRALCYIRLDKPQQAETDCSEALRLDSQNVKALFRRAQAKKMLSHYKESIADLTALLKMDAKNTAAKKELELVKNYWREQLRTIQEENKKKKEEENLVQQQKEKKRLVIEEVDKSSEEDEKEKSKKDTPPKKAEGGSKSRKNRKRAQRDRKREEPTIPVLTQAPKLSKATPYEFMQAWNSLKATDDEKLYADLLEQIEPEQLPKLISNKLDGAMMSMIIKCVVLYFGDKENHHIGYGILEHLCKVPRFSMVSMFMKDQEKLGLQIALQRLQLAGGYDVSNIAHLQKQYGVR